MQGQITKSTFNEQQMYDGRWKQDLVSQRLKRKGKDYRLFIAK
jgi:hypothetical protein